VRLKPFRLRSIGRFTPVAVVIFIGLTLSAVAWQATSRWQHGEEYNRFANHVETIRSEIELDMSRCEETLYGLQALFASSKEVDEQEWKTFVGTVLQAHNLAAPENNAGPDHGDDADRANRSTNGRKHLSFVAYIPGEGERPGSFGQPVESQAAGNPEQAPRYVVKYLAPPTESVVPVGFDAYSEPVWRAALEQSALDEHVTMTGKYRPGAFSDDESHVFLSLPIYRNGEPHDTVAQRRVALAGWVVAEVCIDEVVREVLHEETLPLDVEVFDQGVPSRQTLLHDNDLELHIEEQERPEFFTVSNLTLHERAWTLFFSAKPEFHEASTYIIRGTVLGGGMLITALLAAIAWSLVSKREAAQALADEMTASLRESEADLRVAHDDLERRVQQRTLELTRTNETLQEEITGRTRAELRLEAKVQQLNQANAELKDFAHIISHDLKAPLRAIGTLAHWISTDSAEGLDEEGRENLDTLIGRVKRLDALIDGVLRYSRAGRSAVRLETISSEEIAREVIDSLDVPEGLSIDVQGPLPTVHYDRTHLQQLLQNLIGNAIQHMDKPTGRILVFCRQEGGVIEFCVEDNGVGIEEKHFERIFKVFQSLKPRDEREACGIGLSLVKTIAERHGGRVRVESTVGQGTKFFFTIEQRNAEPRATATPEEHGEPLTAEFAIAASVAI